MESQRNIKCPSCPRFFLKKADLLKHEKHCSKTTSFYCPYCPKKQRFQKEEMYRIHLKLVHYQSQSVGSCSSVSSPVLSSPSTSISSTQKRSVDVSQDAEESQKKKQAAETLSSPMSSAELCHQVGKGINDPQVSQSQNEDVAEEEAPLVIDFEPREDPAEKEDEKVEESPVQKVVYSCDFCSNIYLNNRSLTRHISKDHPLKDFDLIQESCGKAVQIYRLQNTTNMVDVDRLMEYLRGKIMATLSKALKEMLMFKFQIVLSVSYDITDEHTSENILQDHQKQGFLSCDYKTVISAQDIPRRLNEALCSVENQAAERTLTGSKWVLRQLTYVDIKVAKCVALSGGCLSVELPKSIKHKKAIISIDTQQYCFLYCIAARLFINENGKPHNSRRSVFEKKFDEIRLKLGSDFALFADAPLDKIDLVEKLLAITINVYGLEDPEKLKNETKVFPVRVAQDKDAHVDLLLYRNHYYLIENFDRLLSSRNSQRGHRKFCKRCLCGFYDFHKVLKHMETCGKFKPLASKMPKSLIELCEENPSTLVRKQRRPDIFCFSSTNKQEPIPIALIADFESLIIPVENGQNLPAGAIYNPNAMKLDSYHQVCSFAYAAIDTEGDLVEDLKLYLGRFAVEEFLHALSTSYLKYLEKSQAFRNVLELSDQQENQFQMATQCIMCKRSFDNPDQQNYKVRDHDHQTGKYRGAAHRYCNLNQRQTPVIPVVFHNLRGYDAHFIIAAISNVRSLVENIDIIPINKEKFMSFTLTLREPDWSQNYVEPQQRRPQAKYRFIDSFQFLSSSLDKLADVLAKSASPSDEKFNALSQVFPNYLQQSLAKKKGVFPYEYMNSFDRFKETSLPPLEAFYSQLTSKGISQIEYEQAQLVWNAFDCQTLQDYHDVYLKTDVSLLADIITSFRKTCILQYELDPLHYVSLPGLTLDAALLKVKQERLFEIPCTNLTETQINTLKSQILLFEERNPHIELLTDINMHQMFERGIRGGVAMISKRYAKANNKYIGSAFNSNLPNSYIVYLDANNLYGHAMSMSLPVGGFKYVDSSFYGHVLNEITTMEPDTTHGYVLEVDLEYPSHLHELHSDYPLAPETTSWRRLGELGEYQKYLMQQKLVPKSADMDKLIPHLSGRKNYVLHYLNLQFYMKCGIRVTKIHNIVRFQQAPILKSYIEENTKRRQQSQSDFEKNLYKLLNNSLFGKLMENKRRRKEVKLATTASQAIQYASKPWFNDVVVLDPNLTLFSMSTKHTYLDKPIFIGFTVLELAKLHMYRFHYDVMLPAYGNDPKRVKLLFTDTDSLCYEVFTDDIYKDFETSPLFKEWLDTSKYPPNHPLYSENNKLVIGKMKDEMDGKIITEFVGLKPKMYSMQYSMKTSIDLLDKKANPKQKIVAKGVSKTVINNCLYFDDYKSILDDSIAAFHKYVHGCEGETGTTKEDGSKTSCILRKPMVNIRSFKHQVYTITQNKIALTPFDDKRIIEEDGVHTKAFGYVRHSEESTASAYVPSYTQNDFICDFESYE